MKYKLPCELIRDLFPSYIDGLTSDVTNDAVEEHIAECEACRNILEAMKEPAVASFDSVDKTEIDFLKKTRKANRRLIWLSAIAAVCVSVGVLFVKVFLIGGHIYHEMVNCEVSVEGNHLSLRGNIADTSLGISDVDYVEKNGVITVSCKAVKKSFIHNGEYQSDYEAAGAIEQVRLDDRILWAKGEKIDSMTSAVYNTRHSYIGNMPENSRTAIALNMAESLGYFTNELQTAAEPYGWKLILEEEILESQRQRKESMMKSYAYVLLAVIDNLGEVSYEYQINGTVYSLTVKEEDAAAFAGRNIKECGQDIVLLQKLIEKTEMGK